MDALPAALLPLYQRERASGRAMVLAVVLGTEGSTYTKRGGLLLMAAGGEFAGLLSGGCLEADLREHAEQLLADGVARRVHYDARGPDDLVFGVGSGCEGAMDIFLWRVDADSDWQPLSALQAAAQRQQPASFAVVVHSSRSGLDAGQVQLPGSGGTGWLQQDAELQLFGVAIAPPLQMLILGAGVDALPVLRMASALGWQVTVMDHRPALAQAYRFPEAARVLRGRAEELAAELSGQRYCAAVVMSHHLETDLGWLRALADSRVPFIGLLGPAPRRERLLAALGAGRAALDGRLHAPVGLPLGGRAPESIALAIVAEIHRWWHAQP